MPMYQNLDSRLRSVFEEFRETRAATRSILKAASTRSLPYAERASIDPGLERFHEVQNQVRPLFGKTAANQPLIGHFPHFDHLKGTTNVEECPITTLFMDIESSTRLNLLYTPEEVYEIKNAFIMTTMALVRAFDGHVHRIMGDAVMAFFGDPSVSPHQGLIDAVNCAAIIQHYVRNSVIPSLNDSGKDSYFGVRIGLDFAPEGEIIWSSYGYPGMEEVTATSLYVDLASKLQHQAGRHQIMLGQSLIQRVDFPERLSLPKKVVQGGEPREVDFLEPNHTDASGKPLNYRMRLLDWEKYLRLSELSPMDLDGVGSVTDSAAGLQIQASEHAEMRGAFLGDLKSLARPLAKGRGVLYSINLGFQPNLPYTVSFSVENHGKEASLAENNGNHSQSYTVVSPRDHGKTTHWEGTAYKGLHMMRVSVKNDRISLRRDFGVYIF